MSRRSTAAAGAALGATLALLIGATPCGAQEGAQDEPTRATMRRVFGALSTLVPVALENAWEGESEREEVREALQTLTRSSDALARHGREQSVTFQLLSSSLARDARLLERGVAQERFDNASYLTEHLAETCLSCHVRLPAESRPDDASLFERVDPQSLPARVRARLQATGRQFDEALTSYEALFADPDLRPAFAVFSEIPGAYLIVALRVRRDAERALSGLRILAARDDLTAQLKQNLATWIEALETLAPDLAGPPSVERARAILEAGRAQAQFPRDSADLVHAIVASSLLLRTLEAEPHSGPELAELLYLLARTEAFTSTSFERSESAHYLEQAIRAAPGSDLAAQAYARLELETLLDASGVMDAGRELPEALASWLAELRELAGPGTAGSRVSGAGDRDPD